MPDLIPFNPLLEPDLPESLAQLLDRPSDTLAQATRPACIAAERSPVQWTAADWEQLETERADLFDPKALAAQFDPKAFLRDGYAILEGIMTPQATRALTAAVQQGQRRNDALLESDWTQIDWPGLGRQPPDQKLTPTEIANALGNSQQVPQKNDAAGVKTLRRHSVFAEYFPAGHIPYLMDVLTHPQMLALQRMCLGAEAVYFDHNQLLTRREGYAGGGWHSHRIGAGNDDANLVGPAEYQAQPNANLTLYYPQGFAAGDDGGLKIIRGSHFFRDPAGCQGATDAAIEAGWLKGRIHPLTGDPLVVEHLALPPGSVVCCLSHAAHGVAPKALGRATRWCALYCYKKADDHSGLVQPPHAIPPVWALKAQRGELPAVLSELFRPSHDRTLTGGQTIFSQA